MNARTRKILCFTLLLFAVATPGTAGMRSADKAVLEPGDVVRLAKKVERLAADLGARVFLLARVGRPASELPEGIEFTHVSFAVYSSIRTTDGRELPGYSVYNLYQRDDAPSQSHLVVDFPVDFYAPAHALKAGVIIPTPELQQRLLRVLASGDHAKVHVPAYSAFSSPYNTRYQNCTEYVLDVLNVAIYGTTDMEQLKANARAHFEAQTVRINPLKLFFASLFMPEIRTSDHRGPIRTATFDSIAGYLESNGLTDSIQIVEL